MDSIIWKPFISLAMLIINDPLGLFCMGLLVLLFCIMRFRKQSAMNKELWNYARETREKTLEHEKTLEIHGDHFDVIDNDCERSKKHAHNAMVFCYQILKDLTK